ncbi:MAG: DUF975 family protein [Solobacterium sp.]|nr:DUF975 family protein [Solobacterium sp.]
MKYETRYTNRIDLKEEARGLVRRNYWMTVLYGTLLSVLTTNGLEVVSTDSVYSISNLRFRIGLIHFDFSSSTSTMIALVMAVFIGGILIYNPLQYGLRMWFRHQRDNTSTNDMILCGFRAENYSRVVRAMFLKDLYILAGTMFIIPAILFYYRYYFVIYILEDHPELSASETLMLSQIWTTGQKKDIFALDISFILWDVLAGATYGAAGILWCYPYRAMANALFYLDYLADNEESDEDYDEDEEEYGYEEFLPDPPVTGEK